MFTIMIIFHVIVCFALVLVVLMQSSKGEGLAGAAFGGGGGIGGAVFGGRGAASFLSKATTVLAIVFMLNCGALAFMSSQGRIGGSTTVAPEDVQSVVTREAQREREQALQQQAQRQAAAGDTAAGDSASPFDIKVLESSITPDTGSKPAADTTGGK